MKSESVLSGNKFVYTHFNNESFFVVLKFKEKKVPAGIRCRNYLSLL